MLIGDTLSTSREQIQIQRELSHLPHCHNGYHVYNDHHPMFRSIRALLLLLVLLPGLTALPQRSLALFDELPEMGDSTGNMLSLEEEQRIGAEFMRNIRYSLTLVDDPEINEYLQDLGARLVSHSDGVTRSFTFFIIQDPRINAFAAPGGYIGINSGLILNTANESELAAVLAHEIAHVTQRHLARASEAANNMNLPMAAAILAAMILGSQDPDLAQAAITAAMAGSTQRMINFTRINEQEADRVGMQILTRAGFDANGMPDFFKKLLATNRIYKDVLPDFLKTHPVTLSRISDSSNRAARYKPPRQGEESIRYSLIRSKIRVMLSKNPDEAVRYFADNGTEAGKYGYALALSRKGESGKARRQLQALIGKRPDVIAYQYALAQVEADAGNLEKALAIYEQNLRIYPLSTPLTVQYVFTLLQSGDAAKAREVLHRYMNARPAGPELYRLLAQTEKKAGFPVDSYRAMAEYYYLEGLTREAIRQLRNALETKEVTPYDAAGIRARLKLFEEHAALEAASRKQRQENGAERYSAHKKRKMVPRRGLEPPRGYPH